MKARGIAAHNDLATKDNGAQMATIHFVKDGKRNDGTRITSSVDVDFELVRARLSGHDSKYSNARLTINPDVLASDLAEYRHVVIETEDGEASTSFPEAGFYFLVGLSPDDCLELLDMSGPIR